MCVMTKGLALLQMSKAVVQTKRWQQIQKHAWEPALGSWLAVKNPAWVLSLTEGEIRWGLGFLYFREDSQQAAD